MSMPDPNQAPINNQPSLDVIVTYLASLVDYVGQLVDVLEAALPRVLGSFTMTASATLAVPAPTITANADVSIQARNATAASLQAGAKALYVSTITAGVGFTVATADGTNAAGTELFSYGVTNPV